MGIEYPDSCHISSARIFRDLDFSTFGVFFQALVGNLISSLRIVEHIAHEAFGFFLAAFELLWGESLHMLRLPARQKRVKTKHRVQIFFVELIRGEFSAPARCSAIRM